MDKKLYKFIPPFLLPPTETETETQRKSEV